MNVALATLVPVSEMWNEPTSRAKARPARIEQSGDGRERRARRRLPAPREPRPRRQRRHGQPHAPGGAGERADVEETRQHARPGDDRGADEERRDADAVGAGARDGQGGLGWRKVGHPPC